MLSTLDRWAVFISGRGSNLQALLDANGLGNISLVVSSNPKAVGLKKSERAGVPTLVLDKKIDWELLKKELIARRIQYIFLLGFMRVVPEDFLKSWEGRIWNVHPSLLPKFTGLNALERSYEAGADMGVSVHHVIAELDAGPILRRRQVIESREISYTSLEQAKLRISTCEQELVRESFCKWN